jgi:hypothetical protein
VGSCEHVNEQKDYCLLEYDIIQLWQKIKASIRKIGMDVVRQRIGTRALSEPTEKSIKNICFFEEQIPLKQR